MVSSSILAQSFFKLLGRLGCLINAPRDLYIEPDKLGLCCNDETLQVGVASNHLLYRLLCRSLSHDNTFPPLTVFSVQFIVTDTNGPVIHPLRNTHLVPQEIPVRSSLTREVK